MKDYYPTSIPIRFVNFPAAFKITCGRNISFPYSYGSAVTLYRTPLCGVVQGEYVTGESLPVEEMTYSDTGSDDSFNIKIAFYGWGTFHVHRVGDEYHSFEVRRGVRVENGTDIKKFEMYDRWETRIPSTEDVSSVITLEPIHCVTDSGNGSCVIFDGESAYIGDDGVITLSKDCWSSIGNFSLF